MKSNKNDIPTLIIYDDQLITGLVNISNSFHNFVTSVAQLVQARK